MTPNEYAIRGTIFIKTYGCQMVQVPYDDFGNSEDAIRL